MTAPNDAVQLVPADLGMHRPALVELNVEHLTWIEQVCEELFGLRLRDLLGADVRTYTEGSLDTTVTAAQRHGAYYLVEVAGAVVGLGALRRFADGVAEVKRMYVRPDQRGRRLGATILARLVEDARTLGYDHVRRDRVRSWRRRTGRTRRPASSIAAPTKGRGPQGAVAPWAVHGVVAAVGPVSLHRGVEGGVERAEELRSLAVVGTHDLDHSARRSCIDDQVPLGGGTRKRVGRPHAIGPELGFDRQGRKMTLRWCSRNARLGRSSGRSGSTISGLPASS
jgi:GNAT superfamily N-acetyltransferase